MRFNEKRACAADNAFREVQEYVSNTSTSFYTAYLATTTQAIPGRLATYGATRISSACSCLTTSALLLPLPRTQHLRLARPVNLSRR